MILCGIRVKVPSVPENGKFQAHTVWGAKNIYVRRHITIANKDTLKERKVYLRYIYDDQIKLYCNGEYLLGEEAFLPQTGCYRLTDETVAQIINGDNVIAAYGVMRKVLLFGFWFICGK